MTVPLRFKPTDFATGLSRDLSAFKVKEQADPPIPVDGMTFDGKRMIFGGFNTIIDFFFRFHSAGPIINHLRRMP